MLPCSEFSVDYFETKKFFEKTIILAKNRPFFKLLILKGLKIDQLLTPVSGNLSQMKEQVLNYQKTTNFD